MTERRSDVGVIALSSTSNVAWPSTSRILLALSFSASRVVYRQDGASGAGAYGNQKKKATEGVIAGWRKA